MPFTPEQVAKLKAAPPEVARQALARLTADERAELMSAIKGGLAAGQQTQGEWITDSNYPFRYRKITTPDTGVEAIQRESGEIWYGPEQGNKGTAGWFNAQGQMVEDAKTDPVGLMGATVRGAGPYAVAAGLGALAGSPAGGVGAVPGAMAGVGAYGIADLLGDPITAGVNKIMGTNYQMPSEAIQGWFDKMGVAKPDTPTERIVQTGSQAAAGGLGQVGLGRSIVKATGPGLTQDVGRVMAENPLQQIIGGGGSGVGSQTTAEMGGGPTAQFLAGLGGGALAGGVTRPSTPDPIDVFAPKPSQLEQMGFAPSAPNPSLVELAPPQQKPEAIGALVRKASGSGLGSTAAKAKLAEEAAINVAAKDAAEGLGFDLPIDVFSDNPQVRAAAGLTRSEAASPSEAAWRTTVGSAVDQADSVLQRFDANFVEGQVAPGAMSEKVRSELLKTKAKMASESTKAYSEVDSSVPKATPVKMSNLEDALLKTMDEVGVDGLSAQEKRMLKMIDSEEGVTYGRLIREKDLIGQAIAGKASPYGDLTTSSLKRLYGALAQDQLDNVGRIGGDGLKSKLHAANLLYSKEKALGKRIVSAFGDEFEGSIAQKMRAAITDSSKGGSAEFAKLMKLVPDDLKRETVATAIASVARSARGAERGGFGFDEFAKTYRGLRANPPVYKQIVYTLGPDSAKVMRDLYEVSKRITDARANVLTTGKANQAMVNAMTAQNLIARVLESNVGKTASTAAGAAGGGPLGAAFATFFTNAMTAGKSDKMKAAGALFANKYFQNLAVEAATKGAPRTQTVRTVSRTPEFMRYANKIGVTNNEDAFAWLMNATRAEEIAEKEQK